MAYDRTTLRWIHDRTNGRCHLCTRKVFWNNYGKLGQRGAWEVEHSNAVANGGTNRLNNLYAAHVACNRMKGTYRTRTARGWNGHTRAPLSREAEDERSFWKGALFFTGLGALAYFANRRRQFPPPF